MEDVPDVLVLLGSSTVAQADACPFYISFPKIHAYFTGAGDLLAALLLYHTSEHPTKLAYAAEMAVASLQSVLKFTADAAGESTNSKKATAEVMRARELRLIQCQGQVLNPVVEFRAKPVQM